MTTTTKPPVGDPSCDSLRAATMITAPTLTYEAIVQAMEQGAMYATEGPLIHALRVDGDTVHVTCSQAACVVCHIGSKSPPCAYAPTNGTITEASFPIDPRAQYLRITVIDRNGQRADTRAYFREEWN